MKQRGAVHLSLTGGRGTASLSLTGGRGAVIPRLTGRGGGAEVRGRSASLVVVSVTMLVLCHKPFVDFLSLLVDMVIL